MPRNVAGALALCLVAATAHAQPASRLKDIDPGASYGSHAGPFVSAAAVVYFGATDQAHGRELWRTDGTPQGTRLLRDLVPGPRSSYPSNLTEFDGRLFFVADGTLWTSDGTTSGTRRFRPDLKLAEAESLVVHGGWLYFGGDAGETGLELWRTDGTETGTSLVADIRPGPVGSEPRAPVSAGERVYFTAAGSGGRELWRSDGTAGGTLQVADIFPGGSSNPNLLTVVNQSLFFVADDGVHGRELWATVLDSGVTGMVKDIRPGATSSEPNELTRLGDALLLAAHDGVTGRELWRSDGTTAGTARVGDLTPGPVRPTRRSSRSSARWST